MVAAGGNESNSSPAREDTLAWGKPKVCPLEPLFSTTLPQCTLFEEKRPKAAVLPAPVPVKKEAAPVKKEEEVWVRAEEPAEEKEGEEVAGVLAQGGERYNYAAAECGAKMLSASAAGAGAALLPAPDSYALLPCAGAAVLLELCEEVRVDELRLANHEFFSSTFRRVEVAAATRLGEWRPLATLGAQNSRALQAFRVPPTWARYLRLRITAHWGSEHYCPLSAVQVYGATLLQDLRRHMAPPPAAGQTLLASPFAPQCPAAPPPPAEASLFATLTDRLRGLERGQAQLQAYLSGVSAQLPALDDMQETLGRLELEHRAVLDQLHRTAALSSRLRSQVTEESLHQALATFIPDHFGQEIADLAQRLDHQENANMLRTIAVSAISSLVLMLLFMCFNTLLQVQKVRAESFAQPLGVKRRRNKRKKQRLSIPEDSPPEKLFLRRTFSDGTLLQDRHDFLAN